MEPSSEPSEAMKLFSRSQQETFSLVQSIDWQNHPMGPIENWDPVLIHFLNFIFSSRQPCFLFWSDEAYCFYNDGYIPILGHEKHPRSMGAKAFDIWKEIWTNYTYPQFAKAMSGEATWNIDHFIPISRNNQIVEAYFTYGYSPLFGDDGEVKGVLTTAVETTEKIFAVNAFKEKQEQLNVALEVSKLGYFDWDIANDEITYNQRMMDDWGITPDTSYLEVREFIHPDDQARVNEEIRRAMEENHPFEILYRVIHPKNGIVWIAAKGSVSFKDGKAIRFFGTSLNVTIEQNAKAAIEKAQRDLYQFFMQAPSPMTIIMGEELRFYMANPPYAKMVGRDVVGKTIYEAFSDVDVNHFQELLKNVYTSGIAHHGKEMELNIPDDTGVQMRLLNVAYHPFKEMDGSIKGVLCFHQDVTEHVLDRKRIEQYASDLKSSVQSRDEFLSIASHELKTPMTSLKLQLQMVERRFEASEKQLAEWDRIANGINVSLKQIDRLNELVDTLLDVSTIQSGKMTFNFQQINVKILMDEVIERFSNTASTKSSISLHVPENLIALWDRSRMDQVMVNLISNAIKYAPGPIKVKIEQLPNHIQIIVSDSGPGLESDRLERIFDRFERLGISKNISGLGLGLFIVKQIIEGHNGTITVSSTVGKGTDFIVLLPTTES